MNTNYNNEKTQNQGSDNEATQFEETSTSKNKVNNTTSNEEVKSQSSKNAWKRVAAGAGSGLLIGGVATVLMGMKTPDSETEGKTESPNHKEELSHPEWVDDQVQVATTVNDDMSFGEAFAAARAEVGPSGCFEWHGNLYGTYTAEEWDGMTTEQRAEYSDHFSWNNIDHTSSNVAQHSTHSNVSHHSTTAQAQTAATTDDDIEVVSVNHPENHNDLAHTESHQEEGQTEVIGVSQPEPEVEILGVVHDDETGTNIGGITVDGQEVTLIDVDGNMVFDYMAADTNGNGKIDQDELFDIQDQGLSVNDLGGISNPTGESLASNDEPDYTTDAAYEG